MQKSIQKNSLYNMVKTGASILFPLITFPYISRILLPENVGKINFGLSIVSYFSLLASLGIETYAIRECAAIRDDKEKLSNLASQFLSIHIITTIVSYLALAVTLFSASELADYRTQIMIQSLVILATTLGADWLNSAMEDFRYITLRTVAFQFLSLVLMLLFVHRPADYMKYVVICLVSAAGGSVTNIWYRRRYCTTRFLWDLKHAIEWKRHMKPIVLLFVMILAQTIFHSVDSTMLGLMHGDHEVGIYSAAQKIMNLINQVVASLLWVVLPRLSKCFAEQEYAEANRLLRKVLGFNLLLGLPCAAGCIAIAEDIITVAAGPSFAEAAPVLRILILGFVFSLIGGNFLGNAILLPSKQEKYFMIVCCISAVVNVICNWFFIPLYASKAAAGTTTFCSFVMLLLLLFKVDKHIRIEKVGKLLFSPTVGCIGIVLVCLACRTIDSLWIRVIASVGGSGFIYSLIQIVLKNELATELLMTARKRIGR